MELPSEADVAQIVSRFQATKRPRRRTSATPWAAVLQELQDCLTSTVRLEATTPFSDNFQSNDGALQNILLLFNTHVSEVFERQLASLTTKKSRLELLQNCLRSRGISGKRSESECLERLKEILDAELRWRLSCANTRVVSATDGPQFVRFNPDRGFLQPPTSSSSSVTSGSKPSETASEVKQLQPRHCRQCHFICPVQTRSFCSPGCLHLYKVRSSGSFVRKCLMIRDQGVCALCQKDCSSLRQVLNKTLQHFGGNQATRAYVLQLACSVLEEPTETLKLNRRGQISAGSLWHADHVVPVCEGGGVCGLENYRTLCVPCHKQVTALQRKALAARKREKSTSKQCRYSRHLHIHHPQQQLRSDSHGRSDGGTPRRGNKATVVGTKKFIKLHPMSKLLDMPLNAKRSSTIIS